MDALSTTQPCFAVPADRPMKPEDDEDLKTMRDRVGWVTLFPRIWDYVLTMFPKLEIPKAKETPSEGCVPESDSIETIRSDFQL